MKKKCVILFLVLTVFFSGCGNSSKANTVSSNSETIETEQSATESETILLSETESENTEIQERIGSQNSPIPFGESYTYTFGIPSTADIDNLFYGTATIKIDSVSDDYIIVNVNYDSCTGSVPLSIGQSIYNGSYFVPVSDNYQQIVTPESCIYTSLSTKMYDALYPGGNSNVYIERQSAKYLTLNYNVYESHDTINQPDFISNEGDEQLNSYTTWFLLE